jgi:putative transposase
MSTFTQLLYHIIFSTKNRLRTLTIKDRAVLYKYIWGILENKNCHPYRINGVEDHIHIASHVHPSIAIAPLVKDIKLATTSFIKDKNVFSDFSGWQDGYAPLRIHLRKKTI